MANEKTLNTRIQHKIDTAAHWELATNFKPLEGEIIVYSDLNKIKIGDGKTNVNDLEFVSGFSTILEDEESGIIELNGLIPNLEVAEATISFLSTSTIKSVGIKNGTYEDASQAELVDYFIVQEQEEELEHEDGTAETKYSHSLYLDGDAEITGTLKAEKIEGYATTEYVDEKLDGLNFSEGSAVIGSGTASGENSTVIGTGTASGAGATVIGSGLAEGDNSLVFNNAVAYSSSSVAMGKDSKSGCKGFYWIETVADENGIIRGLKLTLKQNEWALISENLEAQNALDKWLPGDVISYKNGTRYVLKSVIDYITTDRDDMLPIVFFTEELPFIAISEDADINDKTEFSIINPRKPEAGIIPFAESAFSVGVNNSAAGTASIAIGQTNLSAGEWSYTEGYGNTAIGTCSHAEGYNTIAGNGYSHAEGYGTQAMGARGAHAEGWETQAIGNASHAEGRDTEASGLYAHAEGGATHAMALRSHAEGHETIASGDDSHAEGSYTEAMGLASHTEGSKTTADGDYSHAEGSNTNASGKSSHAEGNNTTASGEYSHAEGDSTEASGKLSHAEGYDTTASGTYSHAEGYKTQAIKNYTHAEGRHTIANADDTHVEGRGTVSTYNNQHVQGKYNYLDENGHSGDYAHVVGWGTEANRKNIYTLSTKGDGEFAGDITATGRIKANVIEADDGLISGASVDAKEIYATHSIYSEGYIRAEKSLNTDLIKTTNESISIKTEDIATKQDIVGKKITNGGEVFNNYETSLAIGANSHVEGAGPTSQSIALTGEANATTYKVASDKMKNFAVNDWYKKDNGVIVYVLLVDTTNNTITVSETLSNTAITNKLFTRYRGGLAYGSYSHVEGRSNVASGNGSHAEGNNVVASGNYSHAEGDNQTTAAGSASHAEGYGVVATEANQHAQGKYNYLDENGSAGNYAHIVGNGTGSSNSKRSNAHSLDWNGNAYFAGDVYVGSGLADENAIRIPRFYSGTTEPDESLGQIGDIYIMVGE